MLWWWLSWTAQADVVDRVVAVVRDQPVLASDVHIDSLLAPIDPSPTPFWTSGRDPEEIEIDAVIIRAVAADVSLYQPAQDAVGERLAGLREAFGPRWPSFLATNGLDEDRIQVSIRRRMVVERFLLRSLQADPADREAWLAEAEVALLQLRAEIPVRRILPRAER